MYRTAVCCSLLGSLAIYLAACWVCNRAIVCSSLLSVCCAINVEQACKGRVTTVRHIREWTRVAVSSNDKFLHLTYLMELVKIRLAEETNVFLNVEILFQKHSKVSGLPIWHFNLKIRLLLLPCQQGCSGKI